SPFHLIVQTALPSDARAPPLRSEFLAGHDRDRYERASTSRRSRNTEAQESLRRPWASSGDSPRRSPAPRKRQTNRRGPIRAPHQETSARPTFPEPVERDGS